MNPGDLRDLTLLIATTIVPSILVTWLLVRKRPGWRGWLRTAIAASPIPLLAAILCGAVFVRGATASREACGVDACGMAMMFTTIGGGVAVVAYATGLLVSWLTARLLAR